MIESAIDYLAYNLEQFVDPTVDIFSKAQWFSHVRSLPNPILFKTQTQKAGCKHLAERLTWYLKSKRLWSPLSNKVQISPTAINTLSEKYAVWAKVFNHEIIWLYLTSGFLQWISLIEYKQQLWAVSLIQLVNCVNPEDFRLLYKGIQVTGHLYLSSCTVCMTEQPQGLMLHDVCIWPPFCSCLQQLKKSQAPTRRESQGLYCSSE